MTPDELADLVAYAGDMTLDDEIATARVTLRRILILLSNETGDQQLTADDYTRLCTLSLAGARTVAHLLRDKRALSGEAADGIAGAIGQAINELATEWNIKL